MAPLILRRLEEAARKGAFEAFPRMPPGSSSMGSLLALTSRTPAPLPQPTRSGATLATTSKAASIEVRREPFPSSPVSPNRVPPISPQRVPPISPQRLPPPSSLGMRSNTSRVGCSFERSAIAGDSIPNDSKAFARTPAEPSSLRNGNAGGTGVLVGVPLKLSSQRFRARLPSLPETIVSASNPSAASTTLRVNWSLPVLSQHGRCPTMKWHPDKRVQRKIENARSLGPGQYDTFNLWKAFEKPAVVFPSRFAKAAHLVCSERDADEDLENILKSPSEKGKKHGAGANALGDWKRGGCEEWNVFSSDDDALGFERETNMPEIKSSKDARRYARRDAELLLEGSFEDSLLNGRPNLLVHALLYDVETNRNKRKEKRRKLTGGVDAALQSLASGQLESEVEQNLPLALPF
eukprot:GEMP01036058.1.p1 GENE.GEMP01036058.1~~GEMP01036058.1.p1  ORF type:complete len:408 (+),score=122.48 GEMP01036058.1:76-1299(+)